MRSRGILSHYSRRALYMYWRVFENGRQPVACSIGLNSEEHTDFFIRLIPSLNEKKIIYQVNTMWLVIVSINMKSSSIVAA